MALTLADLKTRADDRRRDITNSFVADAELTRYFNEGLRQLQFESDWDFTQTSASISYVTGTSAYTLSAIGNNDFKEPIELFYSYQYKFTYLRPEEFEYLAQYNYNVYAIDGTQLKIKTTFGTQTLTFDYYSTYMAKTSGGSWQEELSASTDEPLVPNIYRDILVDYVVMRIAEKEGSDRDILRTQNMWERRLSKLKEKYWSKAARFKPHLRGPRDVQSVLYDGKADPLRTGL